MDDLFLLCAFISMIAFLISLANADIFIRLFKNKLNKAEVRIVLGLAIFLFFLAFGITCDSVENKNNSEPAVNQKVATDVKEQSNQEEPTKPAEQPVEQKEQLEISISQPENNAEVTADTAEIKGSVSNKDAKISLSGFKKAIVVDSSGNFSLTVNLIKGENKFNIVAEKDDLRAEKEISITRNLTAEEIRKQFKTESKSISYKELFRNIDNYIDQKVYYTGKVIQVIGDGNFLSSMRVEVTRGSYGIWNDVVLINNWDAKAPKILENDVIKFWGTVQGEQSYETVLGATVTVPEIDAEIIELSK